jgi:hypothetical protein
VASAFTALVEDIEKVKHLPPIPSARADHLALYPDGEMIGDLLEIDLAPLLGLDPAPHRILKLANLNAVELFRVAESKQRLESKMRLEGWPSMLCHDMAMVSAMHRAPVVDGSAKGLLDLYRLLVLVPEMRNVWLYLLDRIGRAWPSLVRSEITLEIYYAEQRLALAGAIQASAQAEALDADPLSPTIAPEVTPEPTAEERQAEAESQGLLPSEELHPNA